ncbi:hypothetical protein ACVUUU_001057 [Campylobacter coli]
MAKSLKLKEELRFYLATYIAKMHTQNGLYAISQDEFASTSTFIPFRILDNINKDYLFAILKKLYLGWLNLILSIGKLIQQVKY